VTEDEKKNVLISAVRVSAAKARLEAAITLFEAAAIEQDVEQAEDRRAEAHAQLDALFDLKWSAQTGLLDKYRG